MNMKDPEFGNMILLFLICIVGIGISVTIFIMLIWNTLKGKVRADKKQKRFSKMSLSNKLFIGLPILAFLSFLLFPYLDLNGLTISGFSFLTGDPWSYIDRSVFLGRIGFALFLLCCINAIWSYDDESYHHHIILGVLMFTPILYVYVNFVSNISSGFIQIFVQTHYGFGYYLYVLCAITYIIVACLSKKIDGTTTITREEPHEGGYCAHCGKPLSEEQSFCPYCGTKRNE